MKTIPLLSGQSIVVDDIDFDYVNQYRWSLEKPTNRVFTNNPSGLGLHRHLVPGRRRLSHKNGDPFDFRRENLIPYAHYLENFRKGSATKVKGVSLTGDGKYRVFLGFYFKNLEDAQAVYQVAIDKAMEVYTRETIVFPTDRTIKPRKFRGAIFLPKLNKFKAKVQNEWLPGVFETQIEAAQYRDAEVKRRGLKVSLNFPESA